VSGSASIASFTAFIMHTYVNLCHMYSRYYIKSNKKPHPVNYY